MCVAVHAARSAAIDCSHCFICDAVNGDYMATTFLSFLRKKRDICSDQCLLLGFVCLKHALIQNMIPS